MFSVQAEENLERSQLRDAVNSQKFYFRKNVVPEDEEETKDPPPSESHDQEYTEMTINTILNGKVTKVTVSYCMLLL